MTRRQAIIIYGPTVVAVAAFFLFEAFGSIIADGSVTVAVTVRSTEPLKLRRVTYDEFRRREDVDECLRNPPPNEALFRDAA
jgi:hypothetical protein